MRIFSRLYDLTMSWVTHRHASWYLGALSFAESSFFPIPPDVMLAPMTLARPPAWWRLALLTTVTSVAGGLAGYAIGYFAFELVAPWVREAGYWEYYLTAHDWFERYGFWAVFVAGFSPIPYKMFTIAAGTVAMPLMPFTVASFIGRGGRFFLVAWLVKWGGPRVEAHIRRHIDLIGWAVVVILVILYFILRE
ncbi:MAG TPA: YqaA family protein [Gammaproteobacteria bacterium]|nr:YqaA family protein [Gammaproteobacteria bacterium]